MSSETCDLIVIGLGGVGGGAALAAARRGLRIVGLEAFGPAHRHGSSHGRTRIIRQAYFEHPDYVPLLRDAYAYWSQLEDRAGARLLVETGLIEIGPPEGIVVPGVLASAGRHSLEVEPLSSGELARRFTGFRLPPGLAAVYERRAGLLLVERCVLAQLAEAERCGASLRFNEPVTQWRAAGHGVEIVTTRGRYRAARLILAGGGWMPHLARDLGVPLQVRAKRIEWRAAESAAWSAARGCPAFYFELPYGHFYGLPEIDELGVKLAEHSGGAEFPAPLGESPDGRSAADSAVDPAADDPARLARFVDECLAGLAPHIVGRDVCWYTMSPDGHFLVDRHPLYPQVALVAGLSGHGFKFAGVLGAIVVELACDGRTRSEAEFLSLGRLEGR